MPKISVIIPVYNVEKYLGKCLDSIINQTLKDIEIICINDGSTDESQKILENFAQKDSRIIIIQRENKGVGYSRNEGIKKAKSKFVTFIDPDDIYPTNDILESLYNKANEKKVNICGGIFAWFTDNKTELTVAKNKYFEGYFFEKESIIEYKNWQFDYGFHRFIYNRTFLIENNLEFPNYKRFQDPPFLVKTMIKAKEFYALDKITYAYRQGHQQTKWSKEKQADLLKGLIYNSKLAKFNQLNDLSKLTFIRFEQQKRFLNSLDFKGTCLYWYFVLFLNLKLYMKHIFKEPIQKYKLNNFIRKNKSKKIIFWGASLFLEDFINNYKIRQKNIIGIVDKNPAKIGQKISSYKIFSPDNLSELKPYYIIFTIKNNNKIIYDEVKKYLHTNHPDIILLPNIFEEK